MPACPKSETFSVKGKGPVLSYPILASSLEEAPVNSFECILLNPSLCNTYIFIKIHDAIL